jgi:hypothetical protein
MNPFLFYLLGFFICYIMDKRMIPAATWRAVSVRFFVALLSWLTIALFILTAIVDELGKRADDKFTKKPYKWL